jgi:hypothetical protein
MVGYPPSSSETTIPMAAVMDLGRSVTYSAWDNPNNRDKSRTETRLVSTPEEIPIKIAPIFFFNNSICRYKGMARLTVAGVSK